MVITFLFLLNAIRILSESLKNESIVGRVGDDLLLACIMRENLDDMWSQTTDTANRNNEQICLAL